MVSFGKGWKILVGGKALQQLGVQLTSPTMNRRLGSTNKAANHPAKTLDGPATVHTVSQTIESTYEDMPDTKLTWELLHPSPTKTSSTAPPVTEPMVSRFMKACLGLLANYFVPEHDDKFIRLNTMYPEATKASVKEQLHHHCEMGLLADALLCELMTGKDAV
ncbi:hypothetical protein H4S08_004891 [Coemansia sp. RSA 1365]|nr:hypothetical protein H4S08_004891 [Coemansia sp. RSA 1365]